MSLSSRERKDLSADSLYGMVADAFGKVPEHRGRFTIPLVDALMAGLAMFTLKDPSLLAFQERRDDVNMMRLFHIGQVPSDTAMREILDPVDPLLLRPVFNDVLRKFQRGKGLESFAFLDEGYLLAIDGTGYFSSQKVHCASCLEKVNKKTGVVTYQHQFVAAVLVHPDRAGVIPLAPEPIIRQDGDNKNDCERNASKRLGVRIRKEHPKLKLVVIEDGLASNEPHIRTLMDNRMSYILGAKPGDHVHLFEQAIAAADADKTTTINWREGPNECELVFLNKVKLDKSSDLEVNFLHYIELDASGKARRLFTWVTDIEITRANARKLMRAARSRWKIENETFNTLKNQGYHCEHNYGHGDKNLSVVFVMLMMLAFLLDQVQQIACPLFRATLAKFGSKRSLWEKQRSHFYHFVFESWRHLYEVMLHDLGRKTPAPTLDSS